MNQLPRFLKLKKLVSIPAVFLVIVVILFFADLRSIGAASESDVVHITLEVTNPIFGGSNPLLLAEIFDTTPPGISNLYIFRSTSSAIIKFDTSELALSQLSWGKTIDYEIETISETGLNAAHSFLLSNLSPSTLYYFQITVHDKKGNTAKTSNYQFTTLSLPDTTSPANTADFEAVAGRGKITLRWKNPPDADFKGVKIMRNDQFYPLDPFSGITVYSGKGSSFVDREVEEGMTYYYTAFSYDESENYSSGAMASAFLPTAVFVTPSPSPTPSVSPSPTAPVSSIQKLSLKDFEFRQEGKNIIPTGRAKIRVNNKAPVKVFVGYERMPEILKTITISLQKGGKEFLYLLRVNKEKTFYSAVFLPPEDPGMYPLIITVLDHKNRSVKTISSELLVRKEQSSIPVVPVGSWYQEIIAKIQSFINYIYQAASKLIK
ncbi:MAG: fibronectin type III domain-containing protein [bacterium]|nr:fibronectin type III domain-containing protein [bacterium]